MRNINSAHHEQVFWSIPNSQLVAKLETNPQEGLTSYQANYRITLYGQNTLKSERTTNTLTLLFSQFKSPIILIFLFTSILSLFLGNHEDALVIIIIVLVSGVLGFWQEKGASDAIKKLVAMIQINATVIRNGKESHISFESIVPGDIVIFNAGDSIPADCLILESKDLYVNEATLTGESYPVAKSAKSLLLPETPLRQRTNSLFMGTYIVSGTAKAVVVRTGTSTELGQISKQLRHRVQETEFEHGVRQFGYFLAEITLMLVIGIFVINVYFARPVLESFLFSLALAIGLTPQLLPAIISINLAHGAKRMALKKVIVKRLSSIENLGSMNILCSDKTGTLTMGKVQLQSATDIAGNESEKVHFYAYLNAFYETGFSNPIDETIRNQHQFKIIDHYKKVDEVPYDFIRKRLSILVSVEKNNKNNNSSITNKNNNNNKSDIAHGRICLMITKGSLQNILAVCSAVEISEGKIVDISMVKDKIIQRFENLSNKGFRILGISYRNITIEDSDFSPPSIYSPHPLSYYKYPLITKEDEINMIFLGFLIFYDPIKPTVIESIQQLKKLGVTLKIISGDNKLVATYVGQQIGLANKHILIGSNLNHMDADALQRKVNDIDIFAEVEPNQKERIILALKKSGNVVGYLGDGINDASALHAADAGISVDSATDIVKDAANIVLLEKDLSVLAEGVLEGRRTFANTMKYVFMATSANFGNMFSMAGASLFLSFLPLLPKQILFTNLLTDLPEMTISTDKVDHELVEKPRHWDIKYIRKFMLTFGLLSTAFDYLAFVIFLIFLNATVDQFRTAWFMESVISASLIVLVIRSRRPIFKSRPSKYLLITTIMIIALTFAIPFILPITEIFNFSNSLDISFYISIGIIILLYMIAAEATKKFFYVRVKI